MLLHAYNSLCLFYIITFIIIAESKINWKVWLNNFVDSNDNDIIDDLIKSDKLQVNSKPQTYEMRLKS